MDITQAAVELGELADWWDALANDILHGTARRWTEQQQERDAHGRRIPLPAEARCDNCGQVLLRRERALSKHDATPVLDGVPYCPAGCPVPTTGVVTRAPGRLDVIDVLADLGPTLLELEDEVREKLGEPLELRDGTPVFSRAPVVRRESGLPVVRRLAPTLGPACDRCFHPSCSAARRTWTSGRHLDTSLNEIGTDFDRRPREAARWLSTHAHRILDPDLRQHLVQEAARMARAARRALGTSERVQRLDRPCPVCGRLSLVGFLERCPRNQWKRCTDLRCSANHGRVVCTANEPGEAPLCECGLDRCPDRCHHGGRHRWDPEDFRRLGLVIGAS